MPTVEELQQDQEFMSSTPADQIGYLQHSDPEFKASSSEDQASYLAHVTNQPTGAEAAQPKPGVGGAIDTANDYWEKSKGIGPGLVRAGLGLGVNMARGAYHAFADPRTEAENKLDTTPMASDIALAGKRMLLDPSQASYEHVEDEARANEAALRAQGKTPGLHAKLAEAGGKAVSMVPMVGPMTISAGERAGKGDVTGAVAEMFGYGALPGIMHESMPGGVLPGTAR